MKIRDIPTPTLARMLKDNEAAQPPGPDPYVLKVLRGELDRRATAAAKKAAEEEAAAKCK